MMTALDPEVCLTLLGSTAIPGLRVSFTDISRNPGEHYQHRKATAATVADQITNARVYQLMRHSGASYGIPRQLCVIIKKYNAAKHTMLVAWMEI